MNKYYISEISNKGNNAGTKARNDIEMIFYNEEMYKLNKFIIESKINSKSLKYYIKNYVNAIRLYNKIKKVNEGIIFYQYPILKKFITNKAIDKKQKNVDICFLIHDLNSLRCSKDKQFKLLNEEIELLNKAKVVITHNNSMSKVLKYNGLKSKIIELEMFDYLNDEYCNTINRLKSNKVVYAGNLQTDKNSFLDKIINSENINLNLNLYGPNFNRKDIKNKNILYKGNLKPEEVIKHLEGSFGLVWDGDSIETCNGVYGEYLKYNNPHKLSMYIAANLPVIVWSKSAIAELVIQENIGFTVESLNDINSKIDNITEEEYDKYLNNIFRIRDKISKGEYTKRCIDEAIEFCNKDK